MLIHMKHTHNQILLMKKCWKMFISHSRINHTDITKDIICCFQWLHCKVNAALAQSEEHQIVITKSYILISLKKRIGSCKYHQYIIYIFLFLLFNHSCTIISSCEDVDFWPFLKSDWQTKPQDLKKHSITVWSLEIPQS